MILTGCAGRGSWLPGQHSPVYYSTALACLLQAEAHAQSYPRRSIGSGCQCMPMVVGRPRGLPGLVDRHAINPPVVMSATELEREVSVETGAFQVMTNSSNT